jgi:hypothetical protein
MWVYYVKLTLLDVLTIFRFQAINLVGFKPSIRSFFFVFENSLQHEDGGVIVQLAPGKIGADELVDGRGPAHL